MDNNMLLTFKNTFNYSDTGDNDTIEFLTKADYTEKNDKQYIRFTYPEAYTLGKPIKATLKVEKDKVTLLKYGKECSQYIFEQGKQHMGHYETEFGTMSVGIFSDRVSVKLDENGGDINLGYRIYFNDVATHQTNLSINLKKQKGDNWHEKLY